MSDIYPVQYPLGYVVDSDYIVTDAGGMPLADLSFSQISPEETNYLGSLFSAAPELLEALRLCVHFIEDVTEDDPNRTQRFFEAREAWRKAFAKADL